MGSYDPMAQPTGLEDAHEATLSHAGKREVKYPFAFKNLDWDEYHRYRPRYPDSMLKMWMSYHRERGGEFRCAHDVGAGKQQLFTTPLPPTGPFLNYYSFLLLSSDCRLVCTYTSIGPGTLAIRLGPHFEQVIVSDAGQANITSAKRNLASPSPGDAKFTCLHAPAESVHTCLPPASVDFVSVGMAFHYFDSPAAIASLAAMLRPGGTLAAVTYGFNLTFPGRPRLDKLWYAAASKASLCLLRAGRLFPAAIRGLANAMAGLDFVPLPTELFEPGVQRVLVNVDKNDNEDYDYGHHRHPLCFVDEDRSLWETAPCRVGKEDVRRVMRDPNWRREEADVAWLRGFLASCQMGFGASTWALAEWRALEEEVGRAPGGRVVVEWPVAMVLATRKKS